MEGDGSMSRRITIALAVGAALILIGGCGNPISPDSNKTVHIKFQFQNTGGPRNTLAVAVSFDALSKGGLQKSLGVETIDMVRLMVLDMSALGSWNEFGATDAGREYLDLRANWQGDDTNWAEWKKFLVDYIPVISDQTLEIRGNEAVGNVTGVVGHTSFAAGLFWGSRVKYWYQGDAHGEEGETVVINLYLSYTTALDPCLAKANDMSPEEAVFNAAFGR
jgi:hypothetical protein